MYLFYQINKPIELKFFIRGKITIRGCFMKQKSISYIALSINILLILANILINIFYQYLGFDLTLKFIGSAIFALLGLINLIFVLCTNRKNLVFSIVTAVGLILGMSGDIAIEYEFIIGAILFALGHVCFLIGFYFIEKFHWQDLVVSLGLAIPAALFIIFFQGFSFGDEILRYVCAIYAVIICFMFGKSITNLFFKRSFLRILLLVAATLFVFSDSFLLIELFTKPYKVWTGQICMALYYPAMLCFAVSIYHEFIENIYKIAAKPKDF